MQYTKLGNSGLTISLLSMGAMNTSSAGEKLKIFDCAYESGVNYFDTADVYENGESEIFLGKFLSSKERSKLIIGSKAFFKKGDSVLEKGLSRKNIIHSVNTSLSRLNTDYLDIFYCHRYDDSTPAEETITTIQNLINNGKILYWGISSFSAYQLCEFYFKARELGCDLPIAGQYAYNLFNDDIKNLKETISKLNIGIIGYYPLSQGILSGKYNTKSIDRESRASNEFLKQKMWDFNEEKLNKAKEFSNLAKKLNYSPSALALKWCLSNSIVSSVLSDVSKIEQLVENLGFLSINMNQELTTEIESLFK
ncbi:aldo/keto reductase [Candidatus Methylospira mobilis]|uniref:Aldo/keto reductase n=1 Tax=Candidatus Methylospira mobilis TaxID=1808979 RepID=A0A5Q0BGZ6_9GAMM|nr:aldo/keto reductase [Candidatus Methylospira mobilis]QFY41398.1 aldo/keto reductase [Candidatus Methylospira mobilis]